MLRVDDLDRAIIDQLVGNGRATFDAVGRQVGLSASAVKRRVDRLTEIGAITRFTALVDPSLVGRSIEAYIEVSCNGTVEPETLRDQLASIPQVTSACTVSGSADALVHLLATDVQDLERAIEQIRSAARVDHTESVIVLSRLIDRRAVGPVLSGGDANAPAADR